MPGTETPRPGTLRCDHCLQELPALSAVTTVIDDHTHHFCCHGCLGVYELIHNESLDAFYRQRRDWQPGRPAFARVDAADFSGEVSSDGRTSRIDLLLSGIRCASCIWLIEKVLLRLEGVVSVRVNYATRRAVIEWLPETIALDTIFSTLSAVGYTPRSGGQAASVETFAAEKQDLLIRFGTAAFFSMQMMLFTTALYAGFFQGMASSYRLYFQLISLALATPVVLYGGFPFISSALRSLRRGLLNMDVLVALGSLSAYLYSIAMIVTGGEVFFDTSAMIITFILLGRFLEAGSRLKAGSTLVALAGLQPQEAQLVLESGETVLVPLSRVNAGELIEVIPGDRMPLDGTVVEGTADVDESMLTGESAPVLKRAGSEVYAGTASLNGRLRIRVTGNAKETLLSKIIRTVEDAQARKAPIQTVADRTSGMFVPAIIVLALATFSWWTFAKAPPIKAIMNAVSVLVIACPCALGLATPLAILVGTSATGKQGILVKGGDIFESVSKTTTVVLDKTGTITRGKPVIVDCFDYGVAEPFMQYCASLEAWSEHPAGRAITSSWSGQLIPVTEFKAVPGMGVSGTIDEQKWLAGTSSMLEKEGIAIDPEIRHDAERLEKEGKTTVFVSCEDRVAGLVGLIDDLRDEALEMISALRAQGLRLMILTGDNEGVARYVARRCGIEEVRSGLGPIGKAEVIRELKAKGETVMMAGDGINDAPALTEANTGVTLGTATGIALESAGVAILNDDLRLIATLFIDSRRCFSVIRQNLAWAFGYNFIALPLAVAGVLHPIVSALLMATSSLVVVANSLRLRKS